MIPNISLPGQSALLKAYAAHNTHTRTHTHTHTHTHIYMLKSHENLTFPTMGQLKTEEMRNSLYIYIYIYIYNELRISSVSSWPIVGNVKLL